MKTNELKAGAVVLLRNGWRATIADNKKGNIRLATVEGFYTETGSIYAHDIACAVVDGARIPIKHTPQQVKLRAMVAGMAR